MTPRPQTASENLNRFRQLVLADPALLSRLRATPDLESFTALAIQLGREHGCEFTSDEVHTAIRERRRAWRATEM